MDCDVVKFSESEYPCTYSNMLISTDVHFSLNLLFSYKQTEEVYMEAR